MHKSIENFLMMSLNRLSSSCEAISRKISEGFDRHLSFSERLQIKFHLMYCKFCRRYQIQLQVIRNALQKRMEQETNGKDSTSLPHSAREKIKRALKDKKQI